MAALPNQQRYTPAEYLALEREAEYKSEYYDGYIVAMTGASRWHNIIVSNINQSLANQLEDRPCEIYVADARVKADKKGRTFTYPDVVVVCEEPRFEDDVFDTLLNPTLLIEVLSPSTQNYDRGLKLARYRTIDSLQEYLLVSQDLVYVEHYVRQGEKWIYSVMDNLDGTMELPSIACTLAAAKVYHKVQFPPGADTE